MLFRVLLGYDATSSQTYQLSGCYDNMLECGPLIRPGGSGQEKQSEEEEAAATPQVVCVCVCVELYLCVCVELYLCVCVELYLCVCVELYLCVLRDVRCVCYATRYRALMETCTNSHTMPAAGPLL